MPLNSLLVFTGPSAMLPARHQVSVIADVINSHPMHEVLLVVPSFNPLYIFIDCRNGTWQKVQM